MAPVPVQTSNFTVFYNLRKVGENTFEIQNLDADNRSVTFTDPDDGNGDSSTIFGDIPQDKITDSGAYFGEVTYVSRLTDNNGIVVSYDNGLDDNNNPIIFYYLLTNSKTFAQDAQLDTTSGPYVVCYASGTLIGTIRGDVAVEDLAVGDDVVTASGERRPIKWIGHRTMTCRGRKDVLPVRIAAHAFGKGRPARDLFVSPAHAVAVDVLGEVLIPAARLINGTTITQIEAESVTYWHVELDSHDLLLAEGLPAESYLDCGNRRFFTEADVTDLGLLPDVRPAGELRFCRPFHDDGPLVDLVRARLQARAEERGWRKVEEAFAGLHLVADGRVIRPDTDGLTARFVLPAQARTVRLVSETSVPAHVLPGSTDRRQLGLAVAALTIDDGLTGARTVALDDPRLGEGFYAFDGGVRWTDGAALLPASLWEGCCGAMFLRLTLAAPALPRWVAPQAGTETRDEVRRNA